MKERPCTLTYDMGELGSMVKHFASEAEALTFRKNNPPGSTVQTVYIHVQGGFRTILVPRPPFSFKDYDKAVEEKRWKEGYFQRTGKQWVDDESRAESKSQSSGHRPGKINSEEIDLDHDSCLTLLGLNPKFSQTELKKAYRQAVKIYHPDKVESLADEFKMLAEKRTKQINHAYSKLSRKS